MNLFFPWSLHGQRTQSTGKMAAPKVTEQRRYTLSVQNIRNTLLILSCTPFCPQNSLNSSGHGLYKGPTALHRDADPCWLQCFPQFCHIGWMSFVWWTILDTHGKLLCVEKPSSVTVLDTLKPVHLAPTTIPCSKALKYVGLPIHPLNGTHTVHNPCFNYCLQA